MNADADPEVPVTGASVLVLWCGAQIGDFIVMAMPLLMWLRQTQPQTAIHLACWAHLLPLARGFAECCAFERSDEKSFAESLPRYDRVLVFPYGPCEPWLTLCRRAFWGSCQKHVRERAVLCPLPAQPQEILRPQAGDPFIEELLDMAGRPRSEWFFTSFFGRMRALRLPVPDADGAARLIPVIRPGEDEQQRAADLLDGLGVRPRLSRGQMTRLSIVGVHPGSNWPGKNCPTEVLADVCTWLAEGTSHFVLVKGPCDEAPVADLKAALDGLTRPVVVAEPPDLGVLAAVLARCALFVGSDSGPGHVAAAVGTPTVTVFVVGVGNPRVWAPRGPRVAVAQSTAASIRAAVWLLKDGGATFYAPPGPTIPPSPPP